MQKRITKLFTAKRIKSAALLVIGTFLMAVAINLVFDPMGLVTGGVTGLAIILKHWSGEIIAGGIPVWLTNLICNIPLFSIAFLSKGKRYLMKTFAATLLLSAWIYVLPVTQLFEDYVQGSLLGAVLSGIGIGMVFAAGATTGGTDLLCDLIHIKIRHYSIPTLLAVVDGAIVVAGVLSFGLERAVYAIAIVYLVSKISDGILEGIKFAKMAMIISNRQEEIAKEVMERLDRGATACPARGMYSGEEKTVLYCVVSKKQITELIDIVHKIDSSAFVIVNDVREVMGEGFIEFKQ